ncbi:MAG: YqiA/YcfP family alpha/beta fold hydrolase [Burkholderiaceae bacterium]
MSQPSEFCVIYLHGFRSSPESSKAVLLGQWLAEEGVRYECPSLDIAPLAAIDHVSQTVEHALSEGFHIRLIGSSLGGFYASWLMERHPKREAFKAALINPACAPARDLADQVGPLKAWHSEEILQFQADYIDDLRSMEVPLTQPERYMLVAAKGDELLDWNEMVARYPGALHYVVAGSDHSLSDFPEHWPTMKEFLLSR